MLIIVLGYTTPSIQETPEVLYIGHDGDEAADTIVLSDHPRIERLDGPQTRTVRTYHAPAPEPTEDQPPGQ